VCSAVDGDVADDWAVGGDDRSDAGAAWSPEVVAATVCGVWQRDFCGSH